MSTNGRITVSNLNINFSREGFATDTTVASENLRRVREDIRVLGTDLFMFATGELHGQDDDIPSDKTDLKRAAGLYNYAQAITHRLMTARGTHPEDQFFGVPWYNYLGKTYSSSSTVRMNLVQDITDELYKDNRTREVLYVKVNFRTVNIIEIECAVSPINGEQFSVGLSVAS